MKPIEGTVRPTTAADMHLPVFDNTKMVAFNTCPTWGVVRYGHHKAMGGSGRAMALEAGAAAHEAFAALRFFDLFEYGVDYYVTRGFDRSRLVKRIEAIGESQFADGRWAELRSIMASNEDQRRRAMSVAISTIETSGFYDDPRDKKRTVSNIQESLIAYVDKYLWGKYIPFVTDTFIGVEQSFDLTIHLNGGILLSPLDFRFIGRIDGVSLDTSNGKSLAIEENKTASRLDEAWHAEKYMSHQVTGYCIATSVLTGVTVREAVIHGMSIPLPAKAGYDFGGIVRHPVSRTEDQITEWFEWVALTVRDFLYWNNHPLSAPKYTHSCNRYFRPCSFIPFCAEPKEGRQQVYDEMVHDEWSPLDEVKGEN